MFTARSGGWPLAAAALLAGGGCSHSEDAPATAPVDVNAAAAQAQSDINNYLAVRDAPRHGPARRPDDGADGPRRAVARYSALLDAGRYGEAWRMWAGDGRATGIGERLFAGRYARLARVRIVAGTAGAAARDGSVAVPVVLHATLASGRRIATPGTVILRRVESNAWRISAATL